MQKTRRDGRTPQTAGGVPVRCQRHLCKVRHGADRRTASEERDSAGKTFRVGSPHRAEPDAASGVRLPSGNDRILCQRGGFCYAGGKTPPAAHHRQKGGLGRQKRLCLPLCGGWRGGFAARRTTYVSVGRG